MRPEIPKIIDNIIGFDVLIRLMKSCWAEEPHERPNIRHVRQGVLSGTVLQYVCLHVGTFRDVCLTFILTNE